MDETFFLRPATLQDADLLLAWRKDPLTRSASHTAAAVLKGDHLAWLEKKLATHDCQLFIAEENNIPVGTVRADWVAGVWVLSWSVAAHARGQGVAKRMVSLCASLIDAPIGAEVKVGNYASARVAEYAGMALKKEAGGVLYYERLQGVEFNVQ